MLQLKAFFCAVFLGMSLSVEGSDLHFDETMSGLRALHAPYYKQMDNHVINLNQKLGRQVVFVVPVGQAVLALREKVIAGNVPGIGKQSELFTDKLGHPQAPVEALASYCNFATITGRTAGPRRSCKIPESPLAQRGAQSHAPTDRMGCGGRSSDCPGGRAKSLIIMSPVWGLCRFRGLIDGLPRCAEKPTRLASAFARPNRNIRAGPVPVLGTRKTPYIVVPLNSWVFPPIAGGVDEGHRWNE
ncbi:MAG: hypothetical protein V4819_26290 [Verrucomicrobiota bacterium]